MPNSNVVLLADDDEDFTFLMSLAFQRAGVPSKLVTLDNGLTVIGYLQGLAPYADRSKFPLPTLILLDGHLRLLTGYQVLDWIRQQPQFHQLPVVILTGSVAETDSVRAMKLGASEYHDKPFSLEELTSDNWVTFMERALPNAFVPSRNVGFMVHNAPLDERMSWAFGVFRDSALPEKASI